MFLWAYGRVDIAPRDTVLERVFTKYVIYEFFSLQSGVSAHTVTTFTVLLSGSIHSRIASCVQCVAGNGNTKLDDLDADHQKNI